MKEKGIIIQDFRKKVLEVKQEISDKDFFLSEACGVYLQNLASAITKKYSSGTDLKITWQNNEWIAYATDRSEITINLNNPFMEHASTRVEKLVSQKGLILHECGHLLFTDFHLAKTRQTAYIEQKKLFPTPSGMEAAEFLTDLEKMNSSVAGKFLQILSWMDNALEDGFIENMIIRTVPGEGKCLMALRNMQMNDFPSVEEQLADDAPVSAITMNALLCFAKYEVIKGDMNNPEVVNAVRFVLENESLIKQITHTYKAYDRMKAINSLFCKYYVFFKKEKEQERQEKQEEQANQQQASQNSQNGTGTGNSDRSGQNNSSGSRGKQDGSGSDNSNNNRENSGQESGSSGDSSEVSGKSEASADGSNGKDSKDDENNDSGNNSQNCKGSAGSDFRQDAGSSSEGSSDSSDSSVPDVNSLFDNMNRDMDSVYNSDINDNLDIATGSVLNDKAVDKLNREDKNDSVSEDNASQPDNSSNPLPESRDMEHIADEIAEAQVKKTEQEKLDRELKDSVADFDFSDINKKVKSKINRELPSEQDKALYEKFVSEGALNTASRLAKEIQAKIKDRQQGGKINGLYNGRYLDRSHLYRMDKRLFCKNDLPEDIPDMAISVLIDTSGSMFRDDKINEAMKTALIIYEFGQMMHIPVMVYGHNHSGSTMCMYSLAEFNTLDGQDKYRICSLTPSGCNRDGMALRFCADVLDKRREENKFVFIISDGRPSEYQSREEAYSDIRNVLLDYSRKNVRFIAFGLGNDQESIEDIYCQGLSKSCAAKFVATDEPAQLPKAVVKAIKSLI